MFPKTFDKRKANFILLFFILSQSSIGPFTLWLTPDLKFFLRWLLIF